MEVAGRIAKKIKDQKFELNKNKEIEKTQIAKTMAEEIEQILLPREQNLYEKVVYQSSTFFYNNPTGNLISRVTNDIEKIHNIKNIVINNTKNVDKITIDIFLINPGFLNFIK